MKLKCVIIDDEQYAIDALARYIAKLENLQLISTYNDPINALNMITAEDKIDFIFMDVEMPGLNGIELAKMLRDKVRYLVFTTNYSTHAIEAFQVQANHYLLKPISFAKFALAIGELLENEIKKIPEASKGKKLQFIKGDSKSTYHYIDPEQITYIEAAKNYVIIHTQNVLEEYVTYIGLSQVVKALDPECFIRVNKSNVIAMSAIRKVEGNVILLKNGQIFQLGNTFRPAFLRFLNLHLLSK